MYFPLVSLPSLLSFFIRYSLKSGCLNFSLFFFLVTPRQHLLQLPLGAYICSHFFFATFYVAQSLCFTLMERKKLLFELQKYILGNSNMNFHLLKRKTVPAPNNYPSIMYLQLIKDHILLALFIICRYCILVYIENSHCSKVK